MDQLNYSDFYQVPNLKFDIKRLRDDLESVLKKKIFFFTWKNNKFWCNTIKSNP